MVSTPHKPLATITLDAKCVQVEVSASIYEYSVESANALWSAYDLARLNRGKPRGMTTDQEQDLLRAMLVASASGLDGALKRLIRDALPDLIKRSTPAYEALETFAQRYVQSGAGEGAGISAKRMARLLAAHSPQERLIQEYVKELTGDSLQSPDQLFKVCGALGGNAQTLVGDAKALKAVFDARNQIIHELDMNLTSAKRKRRTRSQTTMKEYSEKLLRLCASVISDTDSRLAV
jgi:hypothetical protein